MTELEEELTLACDYGRRIRLTADVEPAKCPQKADVPLRLDAVNLGEAGVGIEALLLCHDHVLVIQRNQIRFMAVD